MSDVSSDVLDVDSTEIFRSNLLVDCQRVANALLTAQINLSKIDLAGSTVIFIEE